MRVIDGVDGFISKGDALLQIVLANRRIEGLKIDIDPVGRGTKARAATEIQKLWSKHTSLRPVAESRSCRVLRRLSAPYLETSPGDNAGTPGHNLSFFRAALYWFPAILPARAMGPVCHRPDRQL